MSRWEQEFDQFFQGFDPRSWWGPRRGPGGSRRRQQVFESGEMKYVILRLLKEKPRHGYEIMKALEEKLGGWYTPSAGTVYPTLSLLEDMEYVRIQEENGKKVYYITPEGERFLEENRHVLDDIMDRVRDAFRSAKGSALTELSQVFGRIASHSYRYAWSSGPEDPGTKRILEILTKAAEEIEAATKEK